MDFWQITTLAGLFLAMLLGFSEIYQVWIQRKVISEIRDLMLKLDITTIDSRLGKGYTAIVEKLKSIDMAKAAEAIGAEVTKGISEYASKVDTQQIIDALASAIVSNIEEAIPNMVESAGAEAMQEKAKFIKNAKKDPLGTFLGLAMERVAQTPQKTEALIPGPQNGLRTV